MKLKELRKENKKTQTDIAQQLNLTQQTYAKYELGNLEPNLQTLCKLADFYGVSLDFLVGREYNNEFGYISEDEKALLNLYRTLNKNNKIRLIAEAQGMSIAQN